MGFFKLYLATVQKKKKIKQVEDYNSFLNKLEKNNCFLLSALEKYKDIKEPVMLAQVSLYYPDVEHDSRIYSNGVYNQVKLHYVNHHFILDSYGHSWDADVLPITNIFDLGSDYSNERKEINQSTQNYLNAFNEILAARTGLKIDYNAVRDLQVFIEPQELY